MLANKKNLDELLTMVSLKSRKKGTLHNLDKYRDEINDLLD